MATASGLSKTCDSVSIKIYSIKFKFIWKRGKSHKWKRTSDKWKQRECFVEMLFPHPWPLYDYLSNIKQSPAVPLRLIVEAEKYIKC